MYILRTYDLRKRQVLQVCCFVILKTTIIFDVMPQKATKTTTMIKKALEIPKKSL